MTIQFWSLLLFSKPEIPTPPPPSKKKKEEEMSDSIANEKPGRRWEVLSMIYRTQWHVLHSLFKTEGSMYIVLIACHLLSVDILFEVYSLSSLNSSIKTETTLLIYLGFRKYMDTLQSADVFEKPDTKH